MKKIIAAVVSATVTVCLATSALAATKLKVNTETKSYVSGRTDAVDITDSLTQVAKVASGEATSATEKITISGGNMKSSNPMEFRLILTTNDTTKATGTPSPTSSTASTEKKTAEDYFVIDSVKANNGQKVIFNEVATTNNDRKIVLGQSTGDVTYTIEVSANEAIDKNTLDVDPKKVKWEIEYTDAEASFTPTAAPTSTPTSAAATSAPVSIVTSNPVVLATATPTPVSLVTSNPVSLSATATPRPVVLTTATPNPQRTINIICTSKTSDDATVKTVAPGKYRIVGNGHITIVGADGNTRVDKDLTSKKDSNKNGIPDNSSVQLTMNEGDTVTLTGTSDSFVQFQDPTSPTPTPQTKAAAASAKATTNPKATATPNPKATATPNPKTNPETGDSSPIAGVAALSVIALAAAAIVLFGTKKNSGN